MVRPIILIGLNRSGTKWLSNLICRHEDVIAVQSRRTGGILETNMFGALPDKFDLAYPDEYIGLVELWSSTHFFKRTGVEKEFFYRLSPRPRSTLRMFELLMNEYARRHGKAYWLQKTTPLRAAEVLEHFPNARVVVIRRNLMDTLRSTIALMRRAGRRDLFRTIWHCVHQRKLLNRLCRRYAAVEMDYDRLRNDTVREEARLFAELGLPEGKLRPAPAFPRNTSFASDSQRREVLSPRAELLVRALMGLVWIIPLPVLSAVTVVRGLFRRRRAVPLVSDTFGELGDQLADRSGAGPGAMIREDAAGHERSTGIAGQPTGSAS